MTSTERINLALHHKEADRIAIHDGFWATTEIRWHEEDLPKEVSARDYFKLEMRGFGGNDSLKKFSCF